VSTLLISGFLPLVGVGIGAIATLLVQRQSSQDSRNRFVVENRRAHQDAVKAALMTYFERAQDLQGQLDARERVGQHADLKPLIEHIWLAEKALEIICSDELSACVVVHARALHEVSRDDVKYRDWWPHCEAAQTALIAQAKRDLTPQLG
jgi:hypothetical protein